MTNKMDEKHIQLLEENLRRGHWVACKTKGGYWKVFTFYDGTFFQGTDIETTIDGALELGLHANKRMRKDLENEFTNEYKIVTRPPEPFKEGDLVEIIDMPELRRICNVQDKLEMIGKRNTIHHTDGYTVNINKNDTGYSFTFPLWAVAKCLPEEPTIQYTDDELIAEVKRRGLVEKTFPCKHVPGDVDYDSNPPLYLCKKCDELYK